MTAKRPALQPITEREAHRIVEYLAKRVPCHVMLHMKFHPGRKTVGQISLDATGVEAPSNHAGNITIALLINEDGRKARVALAEGFAAGVWAWMTTGTRAESKPLPEIPTAKEQSKKRR